METETTSWICDDQMTKKRICALIKVSFELIAQKIEKMKVLLFFKTLKKGRKEREEKEKEKR